MAGRIVVFGATGYTGDLTARALVGRGAKPVLAARSAERLAALAAELGGLETAVADVSDPPSVTALVGSGDVLVSTVGPFAKWGGPAVEAAIASGAHYIDSTGEPAFIRRVFEEYGPRAESAGVGLITAFGFDWVPGNLAGALALRDAGPSARRIDIGYFSLGVSDAGPSGGTAASLAGAMLEPGFVWRGGIRTERAAARVRKFELGGKRRPAASVGSSEHFALPAIHPALDEVNSYLGWFGPATRPMQAFSALSAPALRIPAVRRGAGRLTDRFVKGSTGGPDAEARAKSSSRLIAIAYDGTGHPLAEANLDGVDGYTFTGEILAWGAITAASNGLKGTGALGPVSAFGLDELEAGVASAGISRS